MTELIRALAEGRRPSPRALVVPLLVLVLAGAALAAVGAAARTGSGHDERSVIVTARGMAFYVDGAPTANPTIAARRGERLRFVLRHQDPGMMHDLALPSLDARTALLRAAGTSAEMLVEVPGTAGDHEYLCTLHGRLMRGVLAVR